jgi:uncharacterized protein (DUF2141 family)
MQFIRLTLRRLAFILPPLLLAPAWATTPGATGGDIAVAVSSVRNGNGEIICALFDDAGSFEKRVPLAKVMARPAIPSTTCVFHGVKAGIYVITAIHDENDNGRLDKTFFGRPTEGYGVSNNHTSALHGPRFDESKFSFSGTGERSIAIHLRYP